jgi:hypothetical protein
MQSILWAEASHSKKAPQRVEAGFVKSSASKLWLDTAREKSLVSVEPARAQTRSGLERFLVCDVRV